MLGRRIDRWTGSEEKEVSLFGSNEENPADSG